MSNERLDPETYDEFLISQYIDDALDDDSRRALQDRVAREPRLAKLLEEYRTIGRWSRDWVHAADDSVRWGLFEASVRRQRLATEARNRGQRRLIRLFVPLAAAAALAMAVLLGQVEFGPRDGGDSIVSGPTGGGAGERRPAMRGVVAAAWVSPAPRGQAEPVVVVAYGGEDETAVGGENVSPPAIAFAGVGADVGWGGAGAF